MLMLSRGSWLIAAIAVTTVVVATAVGVLAVRSVAETTTWLLKHPFTVTNAALEARWEVTAIHRSVRDVLLSDDPVVVEQALASIPAREARALSLLHLARERYLGDKQQVADAIAAIEAWRAARERVLHSAVGGNKDDAVRIMYTQGSGTFAIVDDRLAKVVAFARNKAQELDMTASRRASWIALGAITAAAGFSALLAIVVIGLGSARRRSAELQRVSDNIVGIAAGRYHKAGSLAAEGALSAVDSALATLADALRSEQRLRDELAASEQRFRVAQEMSVDGFAIFEAVRDDAGAVADMRWIYANPTALRYCGTTTEGIRTKTLLQVLPAANEPDGFFHHHVAVVECGRPEVFETYYERDGISGWFRNAVVKMGDGVAVSFSDITEVKRAQLAKSQFLAAASHDLRQPFQAIALFHALLQQRLEGTPEQPIIDKANEALAAGEELLNALLDISTMEAGTYRVELRPLSIGRLMAWCRSEFEEQAAAKGIALRCVDSRQIVRTDEVLVKRILRNLVVNALKFTVSGRVLVGCRRHGDSVRIEVHDTGPGIASHQQSVVFEEFYQIGNPERDRRRGLGLGLAIVQKTARVLHHQVTLRSSIGRGTVFAVTLPLSIEQAGDLARTSEVMV